VVRGEELPTVYRLIGHGAVTAEFGAGYSCRCGTKWCTGLMPALAGG